MTFIELLIVALVSALLITALIQVVSAASGSFQLRDNQAEVLENGRHATVLIGNLIRQAGFTPQPWNSEYTREVLMNETVDQVSSRSDRLVLRSWSDTNCFDNQNPAKDENGYPRFYIRESLIDLNSRNDLAHTCRYGPGDSELITQVNHQGLIRNVESFQALYGEDTRGDGLVDRWVTGSNWNNEHHILAVRIGLLLRSSDPVGEARPILYSILDKQHTARADGRLRRLFTFTATIRSNKG